MGAQPLWFVGQDGWWCAGMPDLMLAHRDDSFSVVDVKPVRLTSGPEVAAVLAGTGRLCAAKGWG